MPWLSSIIEACEPPTWLETVRAGWRGAWKLNPLDPFGSLLDEAVRRAEAKVLSNREISEQDFSR